MLDLLSTTQLPLIAGLIWHL